LTPGKVGAGAAEEVVDSKRATPAAKRNADEAKRRLLASREAGATTKGRLRAGAAAEQRGGLGFGE